MIEKYEDIAIPKNIADEESRIRNRNTSIIWKDNIPFKISTYENSNIIICNIDNNKIARKYPRTISNEFKEETITLSSIPDDFSEDKTVFETNRPRVKTIKAIIPVE